MSSVQMRIELTMTSPTPNKRLLLCFRCYENNTYFQCVETKIIMDLQDFHSEVVLTARPKEFKI
jgi:hypothetical protein